jgi:YegS/Rv2252/BmrU family lipid kinase
MDVTKTDWFFIVNPRAGSGKTMSLWVPAEQKLQKLGIPFVTAMTGYKLHATQLAYEAAGQGYRRIIAVGGDGSLHEALAGIARYCDENGTDSSEFTLGVMPIGSGNDWIKSLDLPNDLDHMISLVEKESSGQMDLVRVLSSGGKVSYMANVGGTGFDSHVCSRVNLQKEGGKRGKLIYLNALRYTITHLSPINLKVVADGKTVYEGTCYSIALGNGRYSGSGMRQVPKAEIDDGILDYMIVPKVKLKRMIKELPRLFNGTVDESGVVISGKCRSLQVMPLDDASADIIELDGEIEGKLPISIEMDGRKIRVLKD